MKFFINIMLFVFIITTNYSFSSDMKEEARTGMFICPQIEMLSKEVDKNLHCSAPLYVKINENIYNIFLPSVNMNFEDLYISDREKIEKK